MLTSQYLVRFKHAAVIVEVSHHLNTSSTLVAQVSDSTVTPMHKVPTFQHCLVLADISRMHYANVLHRIVYPKLFYNGLSLLSRSTMYACVIPFPGHHSNISSLAKLISAYQFPMDQMVVV